MSGSPDQNGVVERKNQTSMDMGRKLKSLWTEALKIVMYILN